MKTNLGLLVLIKEQLDNNSRVGGYKDYQSLPCLGLCSIAEDLWRDKKITNIEKKKFIKYLKKNRLASYFRYLPWYFEAFEIKPRLNWLTKQITELKKEKKSKSISKRGTSHK